GSQFDGKTKILTWKIKDVKRLVNNDRGIRYSDHVYLPDYNLNVQARLGLDKASFRMSLSFVNEEKGDDPLPFTMLPRVDYILKDLNSPPGREKDLVRNATSKLTRFLPAYNRGYYDHRLCGLGTVTDWKYNKKDCIVIEVWITPLANINLAYTRHGLLRGRIENFEKKRTQALEGLLEYELSPYFYTSLTGDRVQVKMWFNGYGETRYYGLSAEINIVNGENRRFKPQTFGYKATLILLCQAGGGRYQQFRCSRAFSDDGTCFIATMNYYYLRKYHFVAHDRVDYVVKVR
ncbi:hypothetical protein CHUAL_012435, partial [Chamberlinius hualienensis]